VRIARSGVGWLVANFGALGASFLATLYFTRALEDPTRTLGLFSVFLTLVSATSLVVNGGIAKALTKRISEQPDDAEAFVGAAVAAVGVLIGLVGIVLTVGSGAIADYFDAGGAVAVLVFLTAFVLAGRSIADAVLSGYGLVGRSGVLSTVDSGGRAVIQAVLVAVGAGLFGLTAGAAAGTGLAALVGIGLVLRSTPLRPARLFDATADHLRSLVEFARVSVLQGFAAKFYDEIDIVVIAAFLGASAVSLYAIPFRLTLALSVVSGAVSSASLPAVSSHAAADEYDRVREILADGVVFGTGLAIPATVGTALLARPLMVTLFTPAFAESATVAVIVVAIQVPAGLRSVFSGVADGIDRPELTLRASLVLIAVNLLLDLLLVPTVGIEGAAVASLVGMTAATVVLGRAVFRDLGLSPSILPVRALAEEVAAALGMGVVVYALRVGLSLPERLEVPLLVVVGVVSYGVFVLAIGREVRPRAIGALVDVLPPTAADRLRRYVE